MPAIIPHSPDTPDGASPSGSLVRLEGAVRALADARTLDDVLAIHDRARAAAEYARAAKLGLEAQNHAAEIKLRAERKAGELLGGLLRQPGARTDLAAAEATSSGDGQGSVYSPYAAVLNETATTRQDAARWQKIADLPPERFEDFITKTRAAGEELTTARALRFERELARERLIAEMREAPPLPDGRYRVFYADPPWAYDDEGVIDGNESFGRAERYYPAMSIAQLCEMGEAVRGMAEDDAVLFMWVPSPFLESCFHVIRAWGFRYKASYIWDKVRRNYGHYNSVRHEFLLIGVRGNCTPDTRTLPDSVVSVERGRHSEKPERFREIIDSQYTWGARIELFARRPAAGWVTWGNELDDGLTIVGDNPPTLERRDDGRPAAEPQP